MTYLPLEHKTKIQEAFARFRELKQQLPGLDYKRTVGAWAFWIGLLAFAASWFRPEWPDFIQVFSGFSAIVGGLYYHEYKKKYFAVFGKLMEIKKDMRALNVHFADSLDTLTVYSGDIADENVVYPLLDKHYQ
jgi:hypothetical protein